MKIYKPYRDIYKSLCKHDVVELRRKIAEISKEFREDHKAFEMPSWDVNIFKQN